ncbi:hypothetical protein P152DRAFT_124190 [Eremomyces bilateralis CBS 781.70]|uniref:Uncharacterized protein n=1 Tax=Eremomyces bilateralis CBS 781.70 TaxID=1392243 RepID=A0A6G1GEV1_9PEZI|nr:uncharacterized protein P152DRAFT_124190 [Eremomyces bilateralis CBS 781.70]KAF1816446.1 hypothetical protein P152DRAFT_124190 [Eremomyces bilateralis CBS 781.70]
MADLQKARAMCTERSDETCRRSRSVVFVISLHLIVLSYVYIGERTQPCHLDVSYGLASCQELPCWLAFRVLSGAGMTAMPSIFTTFSMVVYRSRYNLASRMEHFEALVPKLFGSRRYNQHVSISKGISKGIGI